MTKWISVKDRLPEDGDEVEALESTGAIVNEIYLIRDYHIGFTRDAVAIYTHWRKRDPRPMGQPFGEWSTPKREK